MKKILLLTLLSLALGCFGAASAQTNREIARDKYHAAVSLMDEGRTDDAIALLEEARSLDNKTYVYTYEIGLSLYRKQDYEGAIDAFEKALKYNDATDVVYQSLGNMYDMLGNPEEALRIYDEGLRRFKKSGRLFFEKGFLYWYYGNSKDAIESFLKGVEAEPAFSANYMYLGIACIKSDRQIIEGLMFAEKFMNLERTTSQAQEMSRVIYDVYKEGITIEQDSTLSVNIQKIFNVSINYGNTMQMSDIDRGFYPRDLAVSKALEKAVAEIKTTEVELSELVEIRSGAIDHFFEDKKSIYYFRDPLFKYWRKVSDAGHIEAYNYWVLMMGDTDAFEVWVDENQDKWDSFIEWFVENPMEVK